MKVQQAKTIIQILKLSLDKIYKRIPEPKDYAIKKQIVALSNGYSQLMACEREDTGIDYSSPATQFAYIYKYVTHHASMIYQIIKENFGLVECFNGGRVTISALGGGPGSELVGVMKFMSDTNSLASLRCYLCDRDETWQEAWDKIEDHLDVDFNISIRTHRIDVLDAQSWQRLSGYLDTNIITCVYFMSEIYCERAEALPFFENLLNNVPEGTLLIFIDNNLPPVYNWFDNLMDEQDWEVLDSYEGTKKIEDRFEQKTDLGEYWDNFGAYNSMKLSANIAYRVYRKPVNTFSF
jgi:hypothetical protein